MNGVLAVLLNSKEDAFAYFNRVYIFGSCLVTAQPNDIDILLVYEGADLNEVDAQKAHTDKLLTRKLVGYSLDFTTLSTSELKQTRFLSKVSHLKVKG